MNKKFAAAAAALAVGGLAFWAWKRNNSAADAPRNDAAGPRMPGMPQMPRMPSMPGMPGMPGMVSGAAPNAPRIGPQAPQGMFNGMWG